MRTFFHANVIWVPFDGLVILTQTGVFKAQAQTCNLSHENKSTEYMAGAGVLVAIVLLSSLVRGGGKFATKRQGIDDIFILVCFVLCMTIFVILIVSM